MCYVECNEPEFLAGSLDAEFSRFLDNVGKPYHFDSEYEQEEYCIEIARHFAEWQRMRIAAFIKQLIDEEKQKIKGWGDLYGDSFVPLALARGKLSGFSIIRRELINRNIDKLLRQKEIIVHD